MSSDWKPFALTIGAAVVGSATLTGVAAAGENPFALRDLEGGYLQVATSDASTAGSTGSGDKGGEGSCAGRKAVETSKADEGKCGARTEGKADSTAAAKPAPAAMDKAMEGKCGEGKCGANMPK